MVDLSVISIVMPVMMNNRFSIIKKMNEAFGEGLMSKVTDSWYNEIFEFLECIKIPVHCQSPHNIDCFDMAMNGNGILMHPG
jgi:hypothetical protein